MKDETELNALAYLTKLGYNCVPPGNYYSTKFAVDFDAPFLYLDYTAQEENDILEKLGVNVEDKVKVIFMKE